MARKTKRVTIKSPSPKSPSKDSFTGDSVYSGLASFGKLRATIGLIIAVIIGIGLIIAGIYFLFKKNELTATTTGTITGVNCTGYSRNGVVIYNCSIKVKYTVDGKEYTTQLMTDSNINYYVGETVKLVYDPSNPSNVALDNSTSNKTTGIILLCSGFGVVGIAYFWYWITKRYKVVAAAQGVAGVGNLLGFGNTNFQSNAPLINF